MDLLICFDIIICNMQSAESLRKGQTFGKVQLSHAGCDSREQAVQKNRRSPAKPASCLLGNGMVLFYPDDRECQCTVSGWSREARRRRKSIKNSRIRVRSGKTMAYAKRHTGSILHALNLLIHANFREALNWSSARITEGTTRMSTSCFDAIDSMQYSPTRCDVLKSSSTSNLNTCFSHRVQPSCYHKTGQLTGSRADSQLSGAHAH